MMDYTAAISLADSGLRTSRGPRRRNRRDREVLAEYTFRHFIGSAFDRP